MYWSLSLITAVLSNVVKAKQEGIKVLAYDRMINNADIDYYISFDNEKVGELQAKARSIKCRRAIIS